MAGVVFLPSLPPRGLLTAAEIVLGAERVTGKINDAHRSVHPISRLVISGRADEGRLFHPGSVKKK